MAYNPSTYETVYGFDTLDTFHNYFPELMYDDTIFRNEILHWMRYRLQTLFPQVYPRQQNMYRIYLSQARREMFQTFQNTRNMIHSPNDPHTSTRIVWPATSVSAPTTTPILVSAQRVSRSPPRTIAVAPMRTAAPIAVPIAVPMTIPTVAAEAAAAAAAVAAPGGRTEPFSVSPISSTQESPTLANSTPSATSASSSPQAFPPVQTRSSIPPLSTGRGLASLNVHDPLEDLLTALLATTPQTRYSESALLTSMLSGFGGLGNLDGLGTWTTARNELLSDVLVIPTHAQVESGSEIVHLEDVPEEVSCAVCQERGTEDTWRHLYCEHYFHRACVDRWFSRNVHCPVCRADIRTPNSE